MERMPFQVTQPPASPRSCKASGNEPDLDASVASLLMKTKRVCRSTRAAWMTLSRPDPGSGSGEVGTKTTVRLCSIQSNTASATAVTNNSSDYTSFITFRRFSSKFILDTYLSLVGRHGHKDRDCNQISLPKHSPAIFCHRHSVLHLCRSCNTSKRHRSSFHLSKQQQTTALPSHTDKGIEDVTECFHHEILEEEKYGPDHKHYLKQITKNPT